MGILLLIAIALAALYIYVYLSAASTNTLRELLAAGKWIKANEETARLIHLMDYRARGQDKYHTYHCHTLNTIDRLWVQYSDGHFGFSIQLAILEECEKADSGIKTAKKNFISTEGRSVLLLANLSFAPKYDHKFELGLFDSWERVELIMAWEKLGWVCYGYDAWDEYRYLHKPFQEIRYGLHSPKGHLPVISNDSHECSYLIDTVRFWHRFKNCGH